MDDEIDIEEHDILEHPQVKAIFPDLSKIHIEVHGEDAFLEYPALSEENHSLLEERQDYDGNEVEEKLQDEEEGREYEEEYLEENKEDLEELKKINDHYKTRDQQADLNINKYLVNGSENIVDEVHEISDDEVMNEDADNELNVLTADLESKTSDIVKKQSVKELVQSVQEISDDEENIDIAEVIREIKNKYEEVEKKNCETVTPQSGRESKENGDVLMKHKEIDDEIQETPDNIVEFSGETPQNNENLPQDTEFTNESSDKDIQEQNGHQENLEYSEESKIYLEVPIKQEIEEVPIKTEIIDDEDNFEEDLYNQPLEVYNNKIILGSKPSPLLKSNLYRDTRRNTYLVVALEDWGVHLKESNSYCNQCQILFTTPNALDAHRMVAHSLLAPITNRAVKSTAKSSKAEVKNIAKKSTGTVEISGSKYCNHCNVTFKDHTALIKHLYELLPVKNYTCNFCSETFVNQSDLLTHNAIHIKIEPRKILKAKKNLENNPILTKMLTTKGKSIFSVKQNEQKVIKNILPAEEVKKKLGAKQNKQKTVKRSYPVEVKVEKEDNVQCNFECNICEDVFENYSAARKHRLNHPERKGFNIFKKVFTKENHSNIKEKIQFEDDTHVSKKAKKNDSNADTGIHVKLKTSMKNSNKDFDLIPKDALFQCSTCSIHFASSIAGNSHLSGNKCSSGDTQHWSCPTCKKKLRRIDKNCHTKQHELTSKIRIYKITRNTNERTLCTCLKCGVYFEYILLKMHINKCGKIPTAKCQRCNIVIAKNKIAEHTLKHDSAKLKPKDFILVDYVVVNDKTKKPVAKKAKKTVQKPAGNESKVKIDQSIVKTEPGTQKQSKIISKLKYEKDKTPLFYCKFCKLCLFSKNHIASKRTHLTKSCLGMYRSNAYYCKWCGLLIHKKSRRKHEALHTVKGLTLKDFEFFEYMTHKPVIPPIPKYPSCDKCGIHFLVRKMTKNNHICGEDYENCEFCGEKFEMSALKLHRMFHRLQKPVQREPSPVKILPELMMMYESLNAIWNILFMCGKCELVTDSYNTAVEHSQAHLKKDRSQPNTVKCYICNFKIDNNCWSKHRELHGRMNIQRKDFKLLKYSPENLLDESWFQMFESLPEKEIRQIIDRSVFGSERSLKMVLIKHGLPEFTVYCCSNCKVSYDNNDILEHVSAKCVSSTHICHKCAIACNSANSLEFHQLLHKKGIKKDEFRIVHFVKDKNTEMHVPVKTKPTIKKIIEIKSRMVGERNKNVQFVLYKCKVCTVCIQKKDNIKRHNCAPEHHLHYCNTCKLNFTFRRKSDHLKLHKTQPRLSAKNIKTISFTPRESKDENFTSRPISESKNENLKVTDETIAESSVIVSKFFTKTTEKDLESSFEDLNSSNMKTANKRSSVESFESLVHLLTDDKPKPKRNTLNNSRSNVKHTDKPEQKSSNMKIANKRSSVDNFESLVHLETNNKPKPKRNTLNSSRSIIKHTDTPEKKSAKVYKCDCGLHYTSLKTIEKHIEKCDNSKEISSENCSKCGLLFPTDILVSHLCKHHSHDSVITVQNIHKSETKVASTPKPKVSTKLYKCSDCNVYYLNQNTCYKHTYRHVPLDPKQFIECKICSLQFTIPCLRSHIRRHHEKEFDLEKVLVEEYHPSIGKEAPKIDIYYASERVQNVQVSSSND